MSAKIVFIFPIASMLYLSCPKQLQASIEPEHSSLNEQSQALPNEQHTLLYLSCATANLASQNYTAALEDYQKALETLGEGADSSVEFLAYFGMAIACDHLNLPELCNNNLLQIETLIRIAEGEKEQTVELMPCSSNATRDYLRTLAQTSPSAEIRSTLLLFISQIFAPISISHSFSSCDMKSGRDLNECRLAKKGHKSFWERLEKLAHNINRTLDKILSLIERCLDIKDRVQGTSKDHQN